MTQKEKQDAQINMIMGCIEESDVDFSTIEIDFDSQAMVHICVIDSLRLNLLVSVISPTSLSISLQLDGEYVSQTTDSIKAKNLADISKKIPNLVSKLVKTSNISEKKSQSFILPEHGKRGKVSISKSSNGASTTFDTCTEALLFVNAYHGMVMFGFDELNVLMTNDREFKPMPSLLGQFDLVRFPKLTLVYTQKGISICYKGGEINLGILDGAFSTLVPETGNHREIEAHILDTCFRNKNLFKKHILTTQLTDNMSFEELELIKYINYCLKISIESNAEFDIKIGTFNLEVLRPNRGISNPLWARLSYNGGVISELEIDEPFLTSVKLVHSGIYG